MGINFNTHIFPSSPDLRARIPLWLKFYCYEFSNNSLYRAGASILGAPHIRTIQVPAPRQFSTVTDVEYNVAIGSEDTVTKADPLDGLFGETTTFIARMPDALLEFIGLGVSEKMDMSDTKFKGVNKRTFTFKIIMTARTEEDAQAASDICDAFEALALPTARLNVYSKNVDHPPMWTFGIGPLDDLNNDRSWSGQPQLSLLDKVTVSKSGFQDSYAISNGGKLKPLSQTILLNFVELEPAMRSAVPFSSTIINRSTAFWSLGGYGVDGINAGRQIGRAVGLG